MSARYLLRLDDACPTFDVARWRRVENLFDELDIKPIVAVVPDNQDPTLRYGDPDPQFWDKVRAWQAKGWTIGQHGFRHELSPTSAAQYLPINPGSEFVGLSLAEQSEKISKGWVSLLAQSIRPTVWVAPAHSFDRTTLRALEAATPIRIVSDGLARKPYAADGFRWIPQTLWSLTPKRSGVWTVCLHPSTRGDTEFAGLAQALRGPYRGQIASVDEIELSDRGKDIGDWLETANFWRRHFIQRALMKVKRLVRA
jgi:predicted deacetylase